MGSAFLLCRGYNTLYRAVERVSSMGSFAACPANVPLAAGVNRLSENWSVKMPTFFYKATVLGTVGLEADEIILYYSESDLIISEPDEPMMRTLADLVIAQVLPALLACMPEQYVPNGVEVKGFDAAGQPTSLLPIVQPATGVGTAAGARDSNALVGILHPNVGALVTLAGPLPGAVRRPYWAVGPLANLWVNDAGEFIGRSIAVWPALVAALTRPLTVLALPAFYPLKVSHTESHVILPAITAYRVLDGGTIRAQASFRRSRNNSR